MNKIIAITIGDINGIGIEILIEAWKKRKMLIAATVPTPESFLSNSPLSLENISVDDNKANRLLKQALAESSTEENTATFFSHV